MLDYLGILFLYDILYLFLELFKLHICILKSQLESEWTLALYWIILAFLILLIFSLLKIILIHWKSTVKNHGKLSQFFSDFLIFLFGIISYLPIACLEKSHFIIDSFVFDFNQFNHLVGDFFDDAFFELSYFFLIIPRILSSF